MGRADARIRYSAKGFRASRMEPIREDDLKKAAQIALLAFLLFIGVAGGSAKIVNSLRSGASAPCLGYAICQ